MTNETNPLPGGELAAFAVAVESGTVHAAADALELTPSAVTKRIQSLERRLGVRLFDRGRFGLRPTDAARLLYPEARQALAALARAEEVVALERERPVLAMAASHTIGEFLLPGWLAAFRFVEPEITARVEIVNSVGVIEHVRARSAQIGFVEGVEPPGDLELLDVFRDRIVVVVARGHRWSRKHSLRSSDLTQEDNLAREAGSGTRAVAEAALLEVGVQLHPTLEVASTQTLKRALGAGGFALLSELAIETERRSGTLVGIPIEDVDLTRTLRAVRLNERISARAPLALWDWLAASNSPVIE